jgi:uncharacterized iron-regulated membrane protein
MKNLYQWIWRWHFIGGMVSAPITIILAITGGIYLFKDTYEAPYKSELKKVTKNERRKISYQQQLELATAKWNRTVTGVVLPKTENEATEFLSGRFSHKSSLFIDPYTGRINGISNASESGMHTVRKIHGELLLGTYGTKVVELVASWMFVLIITGIYLFWPRERGLKALFIIRTKHTRRIFLRDVHALSGFWLSAILIIVLAGGLPWTDVFGSYFKWVQRTTNTGYPKTWENEAVTSRPVGKAIGLDEMIANAKQLNLKGEVIIDLPRSATGVYSIYNETNELHSVKKIHIDQYTGEVLKSHTWDDIGILMRARLWAMAFHQGEFGLWNWYLMLFVVAGLLTLSVSAIVAYGLQARAGSISMLKTPTHFSPGISLLVIIALLAVLLPLFGASVLFLFLLVKAKSMIRND